MNNISYNTRQFNSVITLLTRTVRKLWKKITMLSTSNEKATMPTTIIKANLATNNQKTGLITNNQKAKLTTNNQKTIL